MSEIFREFFEAIRKKLYARGQQSPGAPAAAPGPATPAPVPDPGALLQRLKRRRDAAVDPIEWPVNWEEQNWEAAPWGRNRPPQAYRDPSS